MARQVYKLIPTEKGGWECVNAEDAPGPEAKYYIIEDTMAPLEHPCDGKFYTSKSQFSSVTKAHGCVELGEKPRLIGKRSINFEPRPAINWETFSKAYDDLKAGKGPEWKKILDEMPKAR